MNQTAPSPMILGRLAHYNNEIINVPIFLKEARVENLRIAFTTSHEARFVDESPVPMIVATHELRAKLDLVVPRSVFPNRGNEIVAMRMDAADADVNNRAAKKKRVIYTEPAEAVETGDDAITEADPFITIPLVTAAFLEETEEVALPQCASMFFALMEPQQHYLTADALAEIEGDKKISIGKITLNKNKALIGKPDVFSEGIQKRIKRYSSALQAWAQIEKTPLAENTAAETASDEISIIGLGERVEEAPKTISTDEISEARNRLNETRQSLADAIHEYGAFEVDIPLHLVDKVKKVQALLAQADVDLMQEFAAMQEGMVLPL